MNERIIKEAIEGERANRANYSSIPLYGDVVTFKGRDGHTIEAILHKPKNNRKNNTALIECHGGCWFAGDARLMETFSDFLAENDVFVLNLNYSLVDQKPFPVSQEEIVDAVLFLKENAEKFGIDTNKIVLCGQSAGANITLGASYLLTQENLAVAAQILVYPYVDFSEEICKPQDGQAHDFFLSMIHYCVNNFDPKNPIYSPIYIHKDILQKLPKAAFVACGKDDLLVHTQMMSKRFSDVGKLFAYKEYKEALHGFLETNRPELQHDPRNSPEQAKMARDCEKYILTLIKEI